VMSLAPSSYFFRANGSLGSALLCILTPSLV
jgi:hypothetical protein